MQRDGATQRDASNRILSSVFERLRGWRQTTLLVSVISTTLFPPDRAHEFLHDLNKIIVAAVSGHGRLFDYFLYFSPCIEFFPLGSFKFPTKWPFKKDTASRNLADLLIYKTAARCPYESLVYHKNQMKRDAWGSYLLIIEGMLLLTRNCSAAFLNNATLPFSNPSNC